MNLKELREKKHMTLSETGVDPALLSRIESGQREMTLRVAKQLAKVYKRTLDYIVAASER